MSRCGYIKVHRSIFDSSTWRALSPAGKSIMIAILGTTNWEPSESLIDGELRTIQKGQCLTSRSQLKRITGATDQNIRTAVAVCQNTNFLTKELTKGNKQILTINKWEIYQPQEEATKESTEVQPRSNHIKEVKEVKKKDLKPSPPKSDNPQIPVDPPKVADKKEPALSTKIKNHFISKFTAIFGQQPVQPTKAEVLSVNTSVNRLVKSNPDFYTEGFFLGMVDFFLERGNPTGLSSMLSSNWLNQYVISTSKPKEEKVDDIDKLYPRFVMPRDDNQ